MKVDCKLRENEMDKRRRRHIKMAKQIMNVFASINNCVLRINWSYITYDLKL